MHLISKNTFFQEAFAGQILSNLVAMSYQKFADEKLNGHLVGDINMDK